MSHTIDVLSAGLNAAARTAGPSRAAEILASATSAGVVDLKRIAAYVGELARKDRGEAADVLEEVGGSLDDVDRRALRDEVAGSLPSCTAGSTSPDAVAPRPGAGATALDLLQMALSIAGLFDPTPVCDGLDGLISLMRGDKLGAAISFASMIPYLGDAAKLGKLGKFADTLTDTVKLAQVDPRVARKVLPELDQLGRALDAILPGSLSKPAREIHERLRNAVETLQTLGRPQPRLVTFDRHELQRILDHVGDEADLIEDHIGPVMQAIERAGRAGARDLPAPTVRRIERLHAQLAPQTFADVTNRMGERSPLHELFAQAERNVRHRAVLREFGDASDDIGRQLARRADLEDAFESTGSARTRKRLEGEIADVEQVIEAGRQDVLADRTPRAAYELIRDEMKRLASGQGIDWPDDAVIHHLMPINLYPELATHPANLLLVRSGRDESHSLMHRLLGGEDSNLWAGFNAAVGAVFEQAIVRLQGD